MKAVLLGLQALCDNVRDFHIRVRTDNTTCLAYINHKGGGKSAGCNTLAREIWAWTLLSNNNLSVEILRDALNTEADFVSSNQDPNNEWSPNKNILLKFSQSLNIFPLHRFICLKTKF